MLFSEVYYQAGLTPDEYQAELEYQLRKTTLGISVGMVKENPKLDGSKFMFDPYAHFGPDQESENPSHARIARSDITEQEKAEHDVMNIHRYKICEIRPPSIEKVSQPNKTLIFVKLNS